MLKGFGSFEDGSSLVTDAAETRRFLALRFAFLHVTGGMKLGGLLAGGEKLVPVKPTYNGVISQNDDVFASSLYLIT